MIDFRSLYFSEKKNLSLELATQSTYKSEVFFQILYLDLKLSLTDIFNFSNLKML